MRAIRLFVVAAFLAIPTLQMPAMPQAKPTEVKGHLMGESIADFLAKENLPDTITPCRQVIQNYKSYKPPVEETWDCTAVRGHEEVTKSGVDPVTCVRHNDSVRRKEFSSWKETMDSEREYWKCREHVKGDVVTIEVPSFGPEPSSGKAKFRDGKLVEVTLNIYFGQALPTEVIRHLSDKYGQPQKQGTLTIAAERNKVAYWGMPDGTEISAIQGGFRYDSLTTLVTFTAKSEAERVRQESQRPKKNPFEK